MTLFSLADRAPDAALVAGLVVNDDAAAAAFVRRFEGRVFGLALSITRDRGLAEEVSQEAFLRAWRAAAVYDQRRASVLTWLLAITRNAAIDTIRTQRSTPIDGEVMERLISTTLSGNPDQSGARVEHLDAAERLRALPPEQARAVVLAVIAGHTAQQVADLEGIPLGTAKTRIRTGLRRMRATVVAEHSEVDDD
ncbi:MULTISPECIES: RNA polymerase sigma factor [Aestuariimicrobium]|uniref:RNA polymerase sigma factor n=1 Tax=Aestuariimicrobium TaxID=396388 RepID=UPI0003B609BF|nr:MULTISPECIES: sigma-70 family RNA polymerase sigma factor [Aestuariimicrobium]CAI9403532.1 ECF RNA polymerase sigma factor SigK [Aestuariimicrobium sp. T2.26MG-19.2B]